MADYPNNYDIDEGLDPTGLGALSASQILQMVRNAEAMDKRGFIIFDEAQPDVVTYPRLKRYTWVQPSKPTILNRYVAGTASWEPAELGTGAVKTSHLADDSVDLDKLDEGTGNALKILRVTSAGTGWEFITILDSISTNSLPIDKLVKGTAGYLLRVNPSTSTIEWFELTGADIINRLSDNSLPINKLIHGSDRQVLRTDNLSSGNEWVNPEDVLADGELPVTRLSPGAGSPLDQVRINVGGSAFEIFTPSTTVSFARIVDEKPATTDGGGFTAGAWQTRTLNTIKANQNSIIVSLSTNQFELIPGNYIIFIKAPARSVDAHRVRLRRISGGGSDEFYSLTHRVDSGVASDTDIAHASGFVAISGSNATFEVQHYCETTKTSDGFGGAASLAGLVEIYTEVLILKQI